MVNAWAYGQCYFVNYVLELSNEEKQDTNFTQNIDTNWCNERKSVV